MRIAHVCPSIFTDGLTYQENLLARQHRDDGHAVLIVSSVEAVDPRQNARMLQHPAGEHQTVDGIRLVRLPYRASLPRAVARKVRALKGLRQVLEQFRPDRVLFHGGQSWEILTVAAYARTHPECKCFVDFHSDPFWSGRNALSRNLLHRVFYRALIRSALPEFEPPLCVSVDVQRFVSRMYGIPMERLEFYPLGGFVHDDETYQALRERGRQRLGVGPDVVVFMQTGKLDKRKRLVESLRAFHAAGMQRARFVIAGAISPDIAAEVAPMVAAMPAVADAGWVNAETLIELLCACDCYLQPGTQSATMQLALCARCPVVLDDVASHAPYIVGNGWLVREEKDLETIFRQIASNPSCLRGMSRRSLELASGLLDYRALAARLYR
jgi:1,2-diacylglycerol 3-alpha-glucosyltransferase